MSIVAVKIHQIPDEFRGQEVVEPKEKGIKAMVDDLIRTEDSSFTIEEETSLNATLANDASHIQPTEDGENIEDSTDVELWAGKRTKVRRELDVAASAALIELVKENWEAINNKKTNRRTIFSKIALLLREKGVKITRDPSKAWAKVYTKWRNLRETYVTFITTAKQTGKGADKLPVLYHELHEILGSIRKMFHFSLSPNTCFLNFMSGNRDIAKPKALSSSMLSGPKVGASCDEPPQDDEISAILNENAELVAVGLADPDDDTGLETLADSNSKRKKARMAAGQQLLQEVVSSINKFQQIEKAIFESQHFCCLKY